MTAVRAQIDAARNALAHGTEPAAVAGRNPATDGSDAVAATERVGAAVHMLARSLAGTLRG